MKLIRMIPVALALTATTGRLNTKAKEVPANTGDTVQFSTPLISPDKGSTHEMSGFVFNGKGLSCSAHLIRTQVDRAYYIVGAQAKDSLGSTSWKRFLNANRLRDAWKPPAGSYWTSYFKTGTIASITNTKLAREIKPRYSEGEKNSVDGLYNLLDERVDGKPVLDPHTLLILDSGGPHSVAMGVELVNKYGYQPVVMLNGIPNPKGSDSVEQGLAVLLYYAGSMQKRRESIKPNAPPVMILDGDRDLQPVLRFHEVNNSYTLKPTDFPSAEGLKTHGITRVVYLNESDVDGRINPDFQSMDRLNEDLKPVVKHWMGSGIQILYTGINPWP